MVPIQKSFSDFTLYSQTPGSGLQDPPYSDLCSPLCSSPILAMPFPHILLLLSLLPSLFSSPPPFRGVGMPTATQLSIGSIDSAAVTY